MLQPKGQREKNLWLQRRLYFANLTSPFLKTQLLPINNTQKEKKRKTNLGANSRHSITEVVAFDCSKEARNLEMKWGSIKHDVSKFHGIYQNVKDLDESGCTEAFVSLWFCIN